MARGCSFMASVSILPLGDIGFALFAGSVRFVLERSLVALLRLMDLRIRQQRDESEAPRIFVPFLRTGQLGECI